MASIYLISYAKIRFLHKRHALVPTGNIPEILKDKKGSVYIWVLTAVSAIVFLINGSAVYAAESTTTKATVTVPANQYPLVDTGLSVISCSKVTIDTNGT